MIFNTSREEISFMKFNHVFNNANGQILCCRGDGLCPPRVGSDKLLFKAVFLSWRTPDFKVTTGI